VLAAVFVAEIGDVNRFPGPQQLSSWAGMTLRPYESDTMVHRGRITKQGNRLVGGPPSRQSSDCTAARSAPPGPARLSR